MIVGGYSLLSSLFNSLSLLEDWMVSPAGQLLEDFLDMTVEGTLLQLF